MMEIFDIVDENGKPTGETVTRKEAHEKGIRHRTAHIWIVRLRGGNYQVLLQKRSENKDSFPGCYDTSSSGHIHAGDDPLESALRELEEELGISADKEDLHFAGNFVVDYEKKFHGKLFKDKEIAFVYVYNKNVELSDLVFQKDEVSGAKWFDMDYVLSKMEPRDPAFCVPKKGFLLAKKWCEEKECEAGGKN